MDHVLLFLVSQIQMEHSIEHLLICLILVLMVQFLKSKLLKQHKTDLEQYSTLQLQLPLQIGQHSNPCFQ